MRLVKAAFFASLMLCAAAASARGVDLDITGIWDAKVYGSNIEAQVAQDGQNIVGVAYIEEPGGKISPYHITGTVVDGHISATHHSGHVFEGEVLATGEAAGVLTTKGGYKVSIQATRRKTPDNWTPPKAPFTFPLPTPPGDCPAPESK